MDSELEIGIEGAMGVIALNRPAAINALSRGMVLGIGNRLAAWRDDPWVTARRSSAELDVLADGLATRRGMHDRGRIRWGLRQVIVERG